MAPHLASDGLVLKTMEFAAEQDHIMDFTRMRALGSLFSLLNQGVRNILTYNQQHQDFPMTQNQVEAYIPKYLIYALLWSMSGDGKMSSRHDLSNYIRSITTIPLPPSNSLIIDYEVLHVIYMAVLLQCVIKSHIRSDFIVKNTFSEKAFYYLI